MLTWLRAPPTFFKVLLLLLICLCVLVYAGMLGLGYGIGAHYHPNAPGDAFRREVQVVLNAVLGAALLLFAVQCWRIKRCRFRWAILQWMCLGLAGVVGYWAVWATTKESSAIARYVGDTRYALPRAYASGCGVLNGVCGTYCPSTGAPIYGSSCPYAQDMGRRTSVELGTKPIMSLFSATYGIRDLGITFEGDLITEIPESDEITFFDQDGMNGFTTRDGKYVYLTDGQRLIGHVEHAQHRAPSVALREPNGVLRFHSPGPDEIDPKRWLRDGAFARDLIESWRCLGPDCEGRFEKK